MDKIGISRNDMLKYFEEINSRLAKDEKEAEILITGGAALTLAFGVRDSTYDIDAIVYPEKYMENLIADIADDYDLHADWLNDGVKIFITDEMNFNEYLKYSNLIVSVIDAESLLAMKLTSARDNSKDMDDSIFLMKVLGIQKEAELFEIIKKYTRASLQTIESKFFTTEAFERYMQEQDVEKPSGS